MAWKKHTTCWNFYKYHQAPFYREGNWSSQNLNDLLRSHSQEVTDPRLKHLSSQCQTWTSCHGSWMRGLNKATTLLLLWLLHTWSRGVNRQSLSNKTVNPEGASTQNPTRPLSGWKVPLPGIFQKRPSALLCSSLLFSFHFVSFSYNRILTSSWNGIGVRVWKTRGVIPN